MRKLHGLLLTVAIILTLGSLAWAQNASFPAAIFDSHSDVGTVLHPGSVVYDAVKKTYTITGSGENMWLAADAFQFAWKKLSGDVTLTADVSFLNKTGNEHKKAVTRRARSRARFNRTFPPRNACA
jgi:TolB protein